MQIDVGIVSILVGLAVHASGTIWWASNITTRMKHLENQSAYTGEVRARLAAVEAALKAIGHTIDRLYNELHSKADKP